MYSYALLEPECYYLVQEKADEGLTLIQVKVKSDHCMYVCRYADEVLMEWKRKSDPIHDIVELLSDDVVSEWTAVYNSSEDAYYEEDDEE
ncbi:MAG: hypothetical protein JWN76_447 [Chitinophagaceae bacterium]|nr:hypothetical protein [Chitinophagaceae bacterium]